MAKKATKFLADLKGNVDAWYDWKRSRESAALRSRVRRCDREELASSSGSA